MSEVGIPMLQNLEASGGPAFPIPERALGPDQGSYFANGMTLRDYFAAKALQGLVGNSAMAGVLEQARGKRSADDAYALMAYTIADAMLAERAK